MRLGFITGLLACLFARNCVAASPAILLTNIPAYGSFTDLSGLVLGVEPAAHRVAVFIYVPGYGWVTKPTCADPLTSIQPDGSWTADITTGGSDQLATRVAALLVGTNYAQPCVAGAANLPTNVFALASASAVLTRQSPGPRWISFCGYDWWVKSSSGLVGPGPNYFSDSTNNVWLDPRGQLHVRITNRSSQWLCAEIISARTFGYGSYRFELASRVDNLNPNVVLGLFTWSDDPVYADRELDIECSRWGNVGDSNNAQFVVQPYDTAGHLVRFGIPTGVTNSTLLFTWETNRVSFRTLVGSYVTNPAPANVISNWTYSLTVPQTGDENARINLWLMNGSAPTDHQEIELIIKSFQFVPLGSPSRVTLDRFKRAPAGESSFRINTDPDRRYQVQASTNLANWQALAGLLATNTFIDFLDATAPVLDSRFFRALSLP
jgi:hypothetical protein